jgi:hypothetical protein
MNFDSVHKNITSLSVDYTKSAPLFLATFFLSYWKLLAIGALIGLAISLLITFNNLTYRAEIEIPNHWGGGYDIRKLQGEWISAANKKVDDIKDTSLLDSSIYRILTNPIWWRVNMIPTIKYTKSDNKYLEGFPEIKTQENTSFRLSWIDEDREGAIKKVFEVYSFMISSGSYAESIKLLNSYNREVHLEKISLNTGINHDKNELIYSKAMLTNLEGLQKRFSTNASISQVLDPKVEGAKYLPINTQILAAKRDIFSIEENLRRKQDKLLAILTLEQFINQAEPLLINSGDGRSLLTQLSEIELQLRQTIRIDEYEKLIMLDRIKNDFSDIYFQFNPLIKRNPYLISIGRTKSIENAALAGLLGGFLITLMISILLGFWNFYITNRKLLRDPP